MIADDNHTAGFRSNIQFIDIVLIFQGRNPTLLLSIQSGGFFLKTTEISQIQFILVSASA